MFTSKPAMLRTGEPGEQHTLAGLCVARGDVWPSPCLGGRSEPAGAKYPPPESGHRQIHNDMNWTAFLNGAARVLDLFGTMSEPVDLPTTDEEALRRDWQAIASDWQAVAKDMNDAIAGMRGRE